jgi:DNA invertase Pin-like site-specific DNA recombinase
MRIAIYARVSTDDKGQDPENQLRELLDWVIKLGPYNQPRVRRLRQRSERRGKAKAICSRV